MHTDEYTISLSREMAVCASEIRSLQKTLQKMEKKFSRSSEAFMDEFRAHRSTIDPASGAAWSAAYEALDQWKQRAKDYEAIFFRMRQ